jgi:hypothetical protein
MLNPPGQAGAHYFVHMPTISPMCGFGMSAIVEWSGPKLTAPRWQALTWVAFSLALG